MQLLSILAYVFGIVFSFWPLLILAPIGWRKGNIFRGVLLMWVVVFVCWAVARVIPPIPSMLIPEPANTYLFFLTGITGIILFGIQLIMKRQQS
jgi:hypothetical protein